MDWKRFDRVRKSANPIELDLVEHYAQGKIGRRDFVKRGTIIGLSVPFMGSIIAACGGDDDDASPTTDGPSGSTATTQPGSTAGSSGGGGLIAAVQLGDSSTGLDPVNMLDLGTYCVCSQSFEYLVGLADDGNIGPTALATAWEPNEAGDVWTFKLREGVKWQSGADFTSADVAATMDRLIAVGNAALDGVIAEGAVDASDPLTAVFQLEAPNGNFPVLVSLFNAQALITPADYEVGTTLDATPAGTGAWILDDFDASSFTTRFRRNPDWWGGQTPLDTIELRGFEEGAVTAMQSRDIDVIQQFTVIGGETLLNDSDFSILSPPSAAHREVWMNLAPGTGSPFLEKAVRQALAWSLDREQMVSTLFQGRAVIANDAPVLPSLPFFDPDAVEQRSRDIDKAKQLLAEAGVDSVDVELKSGDLQDIPDLAAIIKQNAAEAGINITVNTQSNSTFYENAWCPELYGVESSDPSTLPCESAALFGIVDYGHRPTPDVYLSSAFSTGGVWNSSNYANSEFDAALQEYRESVDVTGQTAAMGKMQQSLWEDVPAMVPYFYDYLSGHDSSVSDVQATALGHLVLSAASKSA